MKIILWLTLTFSLAFLGACSSGEKSSRDGATLLEKRCTACHTTERIESQHKTPEEWEKIVSRMIAHGAKVTNAEKTILVDFLSQTYHP